MEWNTNGTVGLTYGGLQQMAELVRSRRLGKTMGKR